MKFYVVIHKNGKNIEQQMDSRCYNELESVLKEILPDTSYSVYSALPKSYKTLVGQGNGGNNE